MSASIAATGLPTHGPLVLCAYLHAPPCGVSQCHVKPKSQRKGSKPFPRPRTNAPPAVSLRRSPIHGRRESAPQPVRSSAVQRITIAFADFISIAERQRYAELVTELGIIALFAFLFTSPWYWQHNGTRPFFFQPLNRLQIATSDSLSLFSSDLLGEQCYWDSLDIEKPNSRFKCSASARGWQWFIP